MDYSIWYDFSKLVTFSHLSNNNSLLRHGFQNESRSNAAIWGRLFLRIWFSSGEELIWIYERSFTSCPFLQCACRGTWLISESIFICCLGFSSSFLLFVDFIHKSDDVHENYCKNWCEDDCTLIRFLVLLDGTLLHSSNGNLFIRCMWIGYLDIWIFGYTCYVNMLRNDRSCWSRLQQMFMPWKIIPAKISFNGRRSVSKKLYHHNKNAELKCLSWRKNTATKSNKPNEELISTHKLFTVLLELKNYDVLHSSILCKWYTPIAQKILLTVDNM